MVSLELKDNLLGTKRLQSIIAIFLFKKIEFSNIATYPLKYGIFEKKKF